MIADGDFLDVGEEGGEAIEILLLIGIEFVIVALGATERRPEPDDGGVADAVAAVLGEVLLCLSAALLRHHVQAVVS